ncbi:hypothetical protein SCP_0106250 [Sparassis crispa]|uniref:Chromatin remodeling factor mit1 n=1 Tax=Sparassis crispa TaxID=139825 RepID=A0A401G6F4_9APHY|nr:hypothetical protein SCP_0106250 [Sparassis crispa]GBE77743.1 hypothetical protein SCP_0106250 [Sparassis crispa]
MSEPLSDPPSSPVVPDPPLLNLPAAGPSSPRQSSHGASTPSNPKALYRDVADLPVPSDPEPDDRELDRILGEYKGDVGLSYYVRCADGIAYKYPAKKFKSRHPDLVTQYEQDKEKGNLAPFDPSAHYVHPGSRIRMVIKVGGNQKQTQDKAARESSSSSSDELARSMESDYSDDRSPSPVKRRSTRAAAAGANKKIARDLPFSPRKTRAVRSFVVPDSAGEDEIDEEEVTPPPKRRTGRATKTRRANLNDEEYADESESENKADSDASSDRPLKSMVVKKKRIVRGKASRPAYGRFRVIVELDYDDYDDPETVALRAHRDICEKCHRKPAHELLTAAAKRGKGRRKKKNEDEEEDENETEKLTALGGWVRCLKCPLAAHWGCLARSQREEILRAAQERDKADWLERQGPAKGAAGEDGAVKSVPEPGKRAGLDAYQTTEFICGSCMKGGFCMMCREVVLKPDQIHSAHPEQKAQTSLPENDGDVEMADASANLAPVVDGDVDADKPAKEMAFRCFTCKRLAHYAHLPVPPNWPSDVTPAELAHHYQATNGWRCADCVSFIYTAEHILAWRPYPEGAVEPPREADEPINYKASLPREYLVKWTDRGYKRTQWVPHMWLLAMQPARLKNFLHGGSNVQLLPEVVNEVEASKDEEPSAFEIGGEASRDVSVHPEPRVMSALDPDPDAQRKVPPAWKTVDRVLDVLVWYPERRFPPKSKKSKAKGRGKKRVQRMESDEEESEGENPERLAAEAERAAAFDEGEQPSADLTETVDEYEERTGEPLTEDDIDRVVWCFIKWDDMGYDDASWDSPPRPGEPGYATFQNAFKRYVISREVVVKHRDRKEQKVFDERPLDGFKKSSAFTRERRPELGQNAQLSLMPFQIEGVNWLCNNWWNHQHCILADEMGLGKTVQIVTFIGYIVSHLSAAPALVVVPNSTISNWVREFERWAPKLRVVPFSGENKAREIIKRYELSHSTTESRTTGAKYHVLITTYETITNNKEFTPVFKKTPRWEVLVVDEGQRLKSDASLLFKKLKELNTVHRIIMTGTPLNNNIRELFNLMNFLDPKEWHDLDALENEYQVLSEENIKQLHTRLRPYFLRRIKSEVLQLPPKNEVIVPISMVRLQREVYLSILSQNLDVLKTLAQGSVGARVSNAISKTNLNNVLMQLRKCLQHPYLVSRDIEPKGLSSEESHSKLIDASAKLGLLKILLPKLQARDHRVLLFSQFTIALDIIQDFLDGEGIKYLRLDGNTKQRDRQKGMDEFNRPGSDVFIYLLSTRAGGVGINLWSADTVIIFDPDFNPHQDLQAIARAHRYGQKKTCLVFKLMVKDSAEERIMQTGKKKLVLDHLIVQNMDDDDGAREDVQSILMFGAETLFQEGDHAGQIHYSEHDIENLIEKTEKEGDQVEPQAAAGAGAAFSFAKVWSADKDSLEEMPDEPQDNGDQVDSWAQTLERLASERAKGQAKEVTGRGVKRRAAAVFPQQNLDLGDTPVKGKKGKRKHKSKSVISDESDAYVGPEQITTSDSEITEPLAATDLDLAIPSRSPSPIARPKPLHKSSSPILNRSQAPQDDTCGLCGSRHGNSACYMTNSSENLAEYRYMLLVHAGDEPLEERRSAIQAIDEALHKRGKLHLIFGQPLRLVEKPPRKKHKKHQSSSAKHDMNPTTFQSVMSMPLPSSTTSQAPRLPSGTTNAVAGPSKRTLSPLLASDAPKKRPREGGPSTCVVCGQSPHHLVKDCPTVAEGSKRIKKEIRRLEQDPLQSPTVNILRNILIKQQRRALASAGGPAVVPRSLDRIVPTNHILE